MIIFRSIRIKFSLLVALVVISTVILISWFLITQEKEALIKEMTNRGISIAQNIVYTSIGPILSNKPYELSALLKIVKDNEGVEYAMFIDPSNKIMVHTDTSLNNKEYINEAKDVKWERKTYKKGEIPTFVRTIKKGNKEILEIKAPIETFGENKQVIGTFCMGISKEIIYNVLSKMYQQVIMISVAFLILGIASSIILTTFMVNPINQLSDGARRIGRGDLDYKIKVKVKDEIGQLANTFNEMTTKLKQAQIELIEKERMKQELQIAQRIQQSLLPSKLPTLAGYSIASYYQATTEVGGDYFDVFTLTPHSIGLVIADVSGKGVPAALLMAVSKSTLRAQTQVSLSPAEVLIRTNSILYHEMQRGMFVTIFYAILNTENDTLTAACAGHNPALLVSANNDVQWIRPSGIPVGHDAGPRFKERISETTVKLKPSDVLLLYSDGITEAINIWGEQFGEQRLSQIVANYLTEDVNTILNRVKEELFGFMGGQPQTDDITMLVIKKE
jgi:sigma-B regulation protein RsbU (phosphoserine phosphatase)